MHMQVGIGDPRHIRDISSLGLLNNLFGGYLLCVFDMDKIGRVQLGSFIDYFFGIYPFFRRQDLLSDKSKKTFGGGGHIVSRIVCIFEASSKKLMVELRQRRPFKLPPLSAGDGTKISGQVFGIQSLPIQQIRRDLLAKKLRPAYFNIKIDIVAYE